MAWSKYAPSKHRGGAGERAQNFTDAKGRHVTLALADTVDFVCEHAVIMSSRNQRDI